MQFFPLDIRTSVYSASFVQFYFVKNDDSYKVAPELAVLVIISSELQIKAFVFSNLIPKDNNNNNKNNNVL